MTSYSSKEGGVTFLKKFYLKTSGSGSYTEGFVSSSLESPKVAAFFQLSLDFESSSDSDSFSLFSFVAS